MSNSHNVHRLMIGAARLAAFVAVLQPAARSQAFDGAVVEEWRVPDRERVLVAPLYRLDATLAVELPRTFLVLVASADHFRWYAVKADDDFHYHQLAYAARATRTGLPDAVDPQVLDSVPAKQRVAAHDVAFRLVDPAHAAAASPAASDRGPQRTEITLGQRGGTLEATVTGLASTPAYADVPLGEPWPPEIAQQRACFADGSTFTFCELLRKWDRDKPGFGYVPTTAPLWIVRVHGRHARADAPPSYLFVLFSTRDGQLAKNDTFVQWFVTSPADAAERAQLDGWVTAGGATGPTLSPRLAAEIARQRATAYAGNLSDRFRTFVPTFGFGAPDGRGLAVRQDGSRSGDHVYFAVAGKGASWQGEGRASAIDYIGVMPFIAPTVAGSPAK